MLKMFTDRWFTEIAQHPMLFTGAGLIVSVLGYLFFGINLLKLLLFSIPILLGGIFLFSLSFILFVYLRKLKTFVLSKKIPKQNDIHVCITGGTKGIGHGLVGEFLRRGCYVSFTGRDPTNVQQVVDRFRAEHGERVYGQCCDVSSYTQVADFYRAAAARCTETPRGAHVDIWINNAGQSQEYVSAWEVSPAQLDAVVRSNILGSMYGSKVAMTGMLAQGYGQIYNLEGYGSAGTAQKGLAIYGTTKAALTYFNRALIADFEASFPKGGPRPNIQFCTIQPGMVMTELLSKALVNIPEGDRAKMSLVFEAIGQTVSVVAPRIVDQALENIVPAPPAGHLLHAALARGNIRIDSSKSTLAMFLGFAHAGMKMKKAQAGQEE